ncbi:hypothetical protein TWF481_010349 [Arthrobotrys musiformis]|uniref:Zn(2)-C6 fungal-type domain-containing protein n=1 Tax=Arthrobotrys musiformis TaxID=47236 RepID=A0AAV9W6I0_9PEZI
MSTIIEDSESRPPRDRPDRSQPRRSHSKSRAGCRTCKERKVKCDESHPTCENCVRARRTCLYEPAKGELPVPPVRKRRRRKLEGQGPTYVNLVGNNVAQRNREAVRDIFRATLAPNTQGASRTPGNTMTPPSIDNRPLTIATRGITPPQIGHAWAAAPGTCLRICTQGIRIGPTDLELIDLYRSVTSKSIPFANVQDQPWQSHAFEISTQNPHFYHITLAISAAHLRYLRGSSTPNANETNHLCKAIAAYRSIISHPDPSGFPVSVSADVRTIFATSTLLVAYLWSCPQDDIYTNILVLTGSRHLVRAFWSRPEFQVIYTTVNINPDYWGATYASYNIGEYRTRGLEMLFPGRNIYSQENIFTNPEAPFESPTQVIDLGSVTRLAVVITVISSPGRIERRIFAMIIKIVFAWVAGSSSTFLVLVKQKTRRAYVLTAHFFAAVWKVGRLARGFADERPENDYDQFIIGDDPSRTWWVTEGPRSLCKTIVEDLGGEWEEWLGWVRATIEDLDGE